MPRRSGLFIIPLALWLWTATARADDGRYLDNQDGTVTDTKQGLMWQKGDDGVERSWKEAVDYCASLDLAGHKDWALPKSYQLEALIDTSHSPTIDPVFSLKPSYYWTDTGSTSSDNTAKYVNFFYGNSYTYNKDNPYYSLCVRQAETPVGGKLAAVFAGMPAKGKALTIHFTPTITGGKTPYFCDWEFGDGGESSANDPTHTFAKEGNYQVVLTVSDNAGAVVAATQNLTLPLPEISGAAPASPEAKAGQEGGASPSASGQTEAPASSPSVPAAGGPQGFLDVLASGQGEPVKDGALGHGLLAYAFANAIAGNDGDQKPISRASDLQANLGQAIATLSHGQQTPEITRDGDDFPVCSAKGSTYVLTIGISHDLAGTALSAPEQDAELIRKSLEKTCPRIQTMILKGEHANRRDVVAALQQVGTMAKAEDSLVLYIGAAGGRDGGRLNWYVNDSSKEMPWFTGIQHDDLLAMLKTLTVRDVVVLEEKNKADQADKDSSPAPSTTN